MTLTFRIIKEFIVNIQDLFNFIYSIPLFIAASFRFKRMLRQLSQLNGNKHINFYVIAFISLFCSRIFNQISRDQKLFRG